MSNSVGKAREHEKWQRLRDDNQNRAKVTIKRESDEELSRRLLALVKRMPVAEGDLGPILRLSYIDSFRLKDIVANLSSEGKIMVTADSGRRILSHVPMVNREKKETDVPKC